MNGLAVDRTVRVLETVAAVAPFGVRCWDPALNQQVRSGLALTAWPESGVGRRVSGFRTASDVYALHGLPGLRPVEYPPAAPGAPAELPVPPAASPPAPPPTRGFVVRIDDLEGRYLSAAFRVALPLSGGLFLSPPPGDALSSPPASPPASPPVGSPPVAAPPGFLLFSSPSRRAPAWLGVVRGELAVAAGGAPAAHALVRVEVEEHAYFGLADAAGRFAVWLHYPAPEEFLGGSPGVGGASSLGDSTWPLRVEVFYSPTLHEPLAGTDLPDYLSLLQQEPAAVFPTSPDLGGAAEPDWTGELAYHQQLVLRTEGTSRLLIRPGDSSP